MASSWCFLLEPDLGVRPAAMIGRSGDDGGTHKAAGSHAARADVPGGAGKQEGVMTAASDVDADTSEPEEQQPTHLVVMAGDGIGPEITAATLTVLREADRVLALGLSFTEVPIGLAALKTQGSTLPDASFEAARAADGVILGPVSHNEYPPAAQGGLNPSGEMRRRLDLYANIRPARSRPGFPPRCGKPVDLVIVRENTEGFYADRSMYMGNGEMMPTPDLALAIRKITREGSTRIAESAFRLAMQRRKHVTAVHKANVLRISDGLFLECTRAVAARYPQELGRASCRERVDASAIG